MTTQALWTSQAGRTACDMQFGHDTLPVDVGAADACPVHKTLVGEIAIVTQAHMHPANSPD